MIELVWGLNGAKAVCKPGDIAVVHDILSFSSTVSLAVKAGINIYPYPWRDGRAERFAQTKHAELALHDVVPVDLPCRQHHFRESIHRPRQWFCLRPTVPPSVPNLPVPGFGYLLPRCGMLLRQRIGSTKAERKRSSSSRPVSVGLMAACAPRLKITSARLPCSKESEATA